MGLNEKILSSREQIAAYTIQPYKAMVGIPAYGNRNISPQLVNPAVTDHAFETARPTQVNRNVQVGYSSPVPVILQNGTSPTSGNAYGRRR